MFIESILSINLLVRTGVKRYGKRIRGWSVFQGIKLLRNSVQVDSASVMSQKLL
jgi:hypothetical protein